MDLGDDRFDVRYDPRRVSPEKMLETVGALGFKAEVVAKPPEAPTPGTGRVALDTLPTPLQALFDRAHREGRPVLLDFFAPG